MKNVALIIVLLAIVHACTPDNKKSGKEATVDTQEDVMKEIITQDSIVVEARITGNKKRLSMLQQKAMFNARKKNGRYGSIP